MLQEKKKEFSRKKKEGEEKKPSITCFGPPSPGGPHLPLNPVFLLPRGCRHAVRTQSLPLDHRCTDRWDGHAPSLLHIKATGVLACNPSFLLPPAAAVLHLLSRSISSLALDLVSCTLAPGPNARRPRPSKLQLFRLCSSSAPLQQRRRPALRRPRRRSSPHRQPPRPRVSDAKHSNLHQALLLPVAATSSAHGLRRGCAVLLRNRPPRSFFNSSASTSSPASSRVPEPKPFASNLPVISLFFSLCSQARFLAVSVAPLPTFARRHGRCPRRTSNAKHSQLRLLVSTFRCARRSQDRQHGLIPTPSSTAPAAGRKHASPVCTSFPLPILCTSASMMATFRTRRSSWISASNHSA
jgi:hypothetical protein